MAETPKAKTEWKTESAHANSLHCAEALGRLHHSRRQLGILISGAGVWMDEPTLVCPTVAPLRLPYGLSSLITLACDRHHSTPSPRWRALWHSRPQTPFMAPLSRLRLRPRSVITQLGERRRLCISPISVNEVLVNISIPSHQSRVSVHIPGYLY